MVFKWSLVSGFYLPLIRLTTNTGFRDGVWVLIEKPLKNPLLNQACRHCNDGIGSWKSFQFGRYCAQVPSHWHIYSLSRFVANDRLNRFTRRPGCCWAVATCTGRSYKMSNWLIGSYTSSGRLCWFLGGIPKSDVKIRFPGAFYRARWMARAYILSKCSYSESSSSYWTLVLLDVNSSNLKHPVNCFVCAYLL